MPPKKALLGEGGRFDVPIIVMWLALRSKKKIKTAITVILKKTINSFLPNTQLYVDPLIVEEMDVKDF